MTAWAAAVLAFGGGVLTGALVTLRGLARIGRRRQPGQRERQIALALLTDALGHADADPEDSSTKEGPCRS